MKIKISDNIIADSRTLFRLEWRNYLPVLIVHERYEKIIKWTLRILTIIGIGASSISISQWYLSLTVAVLLFLVEQFFERVIFEYTIMVVQPFPNFEIDYSQWKTNSFAIPQKKGDGSLCYIGPAYKDKDYAIKFFNYLKSWNWDQNIDKENNIIVSFVIEPNDRYTTYLYANPGRQNLKEMFKAAEKQKQLEKYGKQPQHFVMQMVYWHNLPFKEGFLIKKFLEFQGLNEQFYLTPAVLPEKENAAPEFLWESAIFKFGYKLKRREELTEMDTEYYHPPAE